LILTPLILAIGAGLRDHHIMSQSFPIDLIEHPEGGRFCEVFKSAKTVTTADGETRSALTHIYFSLDPGEVSQFHRVSSDEVWNLYRGEGVTLHTWDGTRNPPVSVTLSGKSGRFCHVVPAGVWQAAEPLSETVLVGCSVAPGFEFSDFVLVGPTSAEAQMIRDKHPAFARFTTPPKPVTGL